MCGICVFLLKDDKTHEQQSLHNKIEKSICCSSLRHRGPDIQNIIQKDVTSITHGIFYGSTLHFRGALTVQPLQDHHGNILLWNGEIFGGLKLSPEVNDGAVLLERLGQCRTDQQILELFAQIHGPWAFVYFKASTHQMWFGRDIFGRRSLLYHRNGENHLALASIALKPWIGWKEVPAVGVYCATLTSDVPQSPVTMVTSDVPHSLVTMVTLYPWALSEYTATSSSDATDGGLKHTDVTEGTCSVTEGIDLAHVDRDQIIRSAQIYNKTLMSRGPPLGEDTLVTVSKTMISPAVSPFNHTVPPPHLTCNVVKDIEEGTTVDSFATGHLRELADRLTLVLEASVSVRTLCQSDRCSRCVEELLHTSRQEKLPQHTHSHIVTHTAHSSIGGATEDKTEGAIEVMTGGATEVIPDDTTNVNTEGTTDVKRDRGNEVTTDRTSYVNLDQVTEMNTEGATNAKTEGATDHVDVGGVPISLGCGHARVAVLFSGGIDSLMIAALADRSVPSREPIDLLNVAFQHQKTPQQEHCRKGQNVKQKPLPSYEVPDRITGYEGLQQLSSINPNRRWNFVQINVTVEELQKARGDHVGDLVYPLCTVLDDSIGCAIWFAARGQGVIINQSGESIPYTSPARVVLVGMGADEQLVGYSRHRATFNTSGWSGLVEEIQMEIERISSRNLGRDDRVISDHSREARFPFLDENVVSFLNTLPLHDKANLELPRGLGEKFLLRLAAERLGLRRGALAPKRAIQFGSRIAKAENRREKGSDDCNRLQVKAVST